MRFKEQSFRIVADVIIDESREMFLIQTETNSKKHEAGSNGSFDY